MQCSKPSAKLQFSGAARPDEKNWSCRAYEKLTILLADLLLMMGVLATRFDPTQSGLQLVERVSWVPSIGLEWSLGVDGLSAPLVVLSGLVTLLSVWASWTIERKSRLYFALLLVQASAQGLVFLSQDFLLFFRRE